MLICVQYWLGAQSRHRALLWDQIMHIGHPDVLWNAESDTCGRTANGVHALKHVPRVRRQWKLTIATWERENCQPATLRHVWR